MITTRIGTREIPMIYTTYEMKTIQEEIAPIGQAMAMLTGRNPEDENDMSLYAGAKHLETIGKFIRILGNAGLEEAGETPDLAEKWILRRIPTSRIVEVTNACLEAINEGMRSEIPEKKQEGPVDVVLEQIEKKREKGK